MSWGVNRKLTTRPGPRDSERNKVAELKYLGAQPRTGRAPAACECPIAGRCGARATSAKLRRRAVRIVRDAAGVDEEAAAAALAAGGHAKTAIVALLAGIDAAEAVVRLDRARGRVRDALGGT